MITPRNTSRALAELARQCEDLEEKLRNLAMALGGPGIYPILLAGPPTPVARMYREHCDHCKIPVCECGLVHSNIRVKICDGITCECRLDHVHHCKCHGDYRKWCDACEIWSWLNGLTNRPTPIILAPVIS